MKHSPAYILFYAVALGVVCAALLTAGQELTHARRDANDRAERVRHILDVLGIERSAEATNAQLVALFNENVQVEERPPVTYYRYVGPGAAVKAVAVEFAGKGLWGPVRGFLSLAPDLRTIRQVTFYEQEETPGLGGEITSPEFLKQFQGRSAFLPSGGPGIEVHAISGATLTSKRVEKMLSAKLAEIAEQEGTHGK